MGNDNIQSLEQQGILKAESVLIGVSSSMIPASLVLLSSIKVIEGPGKWLLNSAIILNIPTLGTLLWHSVRWPVRWKLMEDGKLAALEEFSKDMIHILESVTSAAVFKGIYGVSGEKIIKGPDGKEYLRMSKEEACEEIDKAVSRSLSPDNPIVSNTISAHASKIYQAQRSALTGALDERFSFLKYSIDVFARHTRYWWFFGMIMSASGSIIYLLNK